MPALNEADNMPHVLPRLPADLYELVVVDGGSTDGTVEVVRSLYATAVLVDQSGSGKGDALAKGFAIARGDIIVTLDADGSANPEDIPRFVEALEQGADFAKGSRFLPGGGSDDFTPVRRAGNWALTRLVNTLFRTRFSDLCYGYNAFWAHYKDALAGDADGFEIETAMNIRAAKAGLVIVEVPSHEEVRLHGVSNLHACRDGWRVLKAIFRERFSRSPRHDSLAEALLARVRASVPMETDTSGAGAMSAEPEGYAASRLLHAAESSARRNLVAPRPSGDETRTS